MVTPEANNPMVRVHSKGCPNLQIMLFFSKVGVKPMLEKYRSRKGIRLTFMSILCQNNIYYILKAFGHKIDIYVSSMPK